MRPWLASTILGLFMAMIAAPHGRAPNVDRRVHAAGICWEPDVEFPVPCDDDDD